MPYRAIMITIVSVALSLLTIALWAMAVQPFLADARESVARAGMELTSARGLRQLVQGTLLLAFLLTSFVGVVGFLATWRAWMHRKPVTRPRYRTRYIDIWKLAGERLATPEPDTTPE